MTSLRQIREKKTFEKIPIFPKSIKMILLPSASTHPQPYPLHHKPPPYQHQRNPLPYKQQISPYQPPTSLNPCPNTPLPTPKARAWSILSGELNTEKLTIWSANCGIQSPRISHLYSSLSAVHTIYFSHLFSRSFPSHSLNDLRFRHFHLQRFPLVFVTHVSCSHTYLFHTRLSHTHIGFRQLTLAPTSLWWGPRTFSQGIQKLNGRHFALPPGFIHRTTG